MKPRWVLVLVAVVLAIGVAWGLRKRGGTATADNPAAAATGERVVPVSEATAQARDVPIWLEGLGSATPLYTVTVKTLVDGRLERMYFKEGDAVHAGQVIAQVDPRPFEIALHNAEAALARDTAQANEASLNLKRYTSLGQQKLIAQQQVDDQAALAGQYQGTIKADEAAIESAKLQLDYAAIKSPIDGVTGVRLVDPGNIVHAADPTGIVVITQLDPMAILFTLPEDDLPRVQAELAKGAIPVEAWSRDGAIKLATGKVELIDNQVNQQTATIRLKAICPNPTKALWPNEFVKARLLLSTRKGALTVPAAAVQRGPQGAFVYVIAADNTVSTKPVDVDTIQGELAILTKGVSAGDRVVTDGQNQLRPGAKVAPKGAAGGASPAPPQPSGSAASSSAPPPVTSAPAQARQP
jgi:multidrug efflux system membrane fusion protein